MDTLRYKIYNLFTAKNLRSLMLLAVAFLLTGCEDNMPTAEGKESNIESQIACWQTSITNAVSGMIGNLYDHSARQVAEGGANVILIAFAIWMAFKLLKVLGSFKEENLGEVWTEILQKLFICAVCAFIVADTERIGNAINTFVLPIYQTIIELGLRAIDAADRKDFIDLGELFGRIIFGREKEICPTIGNQMAVNSLAENINGVIDCMVCRINSRLNTGVQISINLIASMRISAFFVGLALLIFFTVAKILFVFFIVDAIFRLNFAVYFLPILIMAIPFNYTRKWSIHGFKMFLNSSGIMLFLGLLISASVGAMEAIINRTYGYEDFEGLGIALLVICMIALLLVRTPALGVSLADKFIGGGGGMPFQAKVTKFVMNSIKKAGAAAMASVSAGTSSLITKSMEKHEITREMLTSIREKNKSLNNALGTLGGKDDD